MNELLNSITLAAKNKEVTIDEVVSSYNEGSDIKYSFTKQNPNVVTSNNYEAIEHKQSLKADFDPLKALGGIGAFIVGLGAVVLIGTNWADLSFNLRLLASLGIGLLLYYVSYYCIYKNFNSTLNNLLIVVSGFWLIWGLYFAVDYTVTDSNSKMIVSAFVLSGLSLIYGFLFKIFNKSLHYTAAAYVGFFAFMSFAANILKNSETDTFNKGFVLAAWMASISGLLMLSFFYNRLTPWIRDLTMLGEYIVFCVSSYSYLVYFNRSWAGGSETWAEYGYSIVFGIWYWIAIKTRSKTLLAINSIGFYYYILSLSFKNGQNVATTLILGGLGLILISLGTYYVSKTLNKKNLPQSL